MVGVFDKNGRKWETGENIKYRIRYRIDEKDRNYFPDFIVDDYLMVEYKPKRLHGSRVVVAKQKAAEDFCTQRGMTYVLLDCELLPKEDIVRLCETGDVVFTNTAKNKFIAFLEKEKRNGR